MFTIEQFRALEVGDMIETIPLLGGLSDTKVLLHTQEVSEDGRTRRFAVTYFGITLGFWACEEKGGRLTWTI